MALALYLATTLVLSHLWSRWIQKISVGATIALIALPLVFTGRAILPGRVYAPLDLPFTAQPLRDYASDFGVEKPHNIALSDLHCQMIPWQAAVRHALSIGEWPLWNPFILNGDILAAAAQPAVYDPLQLLALILPIPDALTFGASMTFFLAAFFTFAFARATGLGEIAALAAASAFTFCGMMAFFVGWPLARAWAYLPLVLVAVRLLVSAMTPARSVRPAGAAFLLLAAFVLVIVAGHPESVLHIVVVGAVYGLSLRPRLPAIVLALGAGVLALLLTAIYLLPFAEAAPKTLDYTIRRDLYAPTSYDVIVSPETRRERILRTFIPFYHGPTDTYGWDPLSGRVGTSVMILAAVALLMGAARRWRRGFSARADGPDRHAQGNQPPHPQVLFWGLLAMVCLLATFGMWPVAHLLHALPLFDIAINERLAFAAALALSMLAAITVDRVASSGRRFSLIGGVVLLALILVERTNEDGRYYPALPKNVFYPRVPILSALPRDARMTGVGTALIANNAAVYGLEDIRGYNAMTFRRLYETYPLWATYQRAWFNRVDDLSSPFLSFLNVRYALAHESTVVPQSWAIRAFDRQTRLLENMAVLPRATVPPVIRYVRGNAAEEMKSATDFGAMAWIEAPSYEPHQMANGPGSVTIQRDGLGYSLNVVMENSGWVVVAESAWPGWRAYIDGKRAPVRFANHAFIGVHMEKGRHQVRLVYLPDSFTKGRMISGVTLLLLVFGGVCYRTRACSRFFSTLRRPAC